MTGDQVVWDQGSFTVTVTSRMPRANWYAVLRPQVLVASSLQDALTQALAVPFADWIEDADGTDGIQMHTDAPAEPEVDPALAEAIRAEFLAGVALGRQQGVEVVGTSLQAVSTANHGQPLSIGIIGVVLDACVEKLAAMPVAEMDKAKSLDVPVTKEGQT